MNEFIGKLKHWRWPQDFSYASVILLTIPKGLVWQAHSIFPQTILVKKGRGGREEGQRAGRNKRGKGRREERKIPCVGRVCKVGWQARPILGSQFFCHTEFAQTCPKAMLLVISLPGILLEWVESQTWLTFSSWPSYFFSTNIWSCGGLKCAPKGAQSSCFLFLISLMLTT